MVSLDKLYFSTKEKIEEIHSGLPTFQKGGQKVTYRRRWKFSELEQLVSQGESAETVFLRQLNRIPH